ncbi:hypothetical protein D7V88_02145 [Corallococcus terminator]|uniref:Uncharacterized protein n=2 Tax=Corallococcus terminator TaxID=2316733 RepID=A0A3A8JVB9_9BACT|nr:hypothetical protein D7V88_02145 [Corallococcus terminator]
MLLAGFVVLAGCASTRPVKARAVVQCIITKQGRAENCQARQWDEALSSEQVGELIRHIQSRDYKPVTYNGKPLDVPYTFRFEFRDPMLPADGGRLFPEDGGSLLSTPES